MVPANTCRPPEPEHDGRGDAGVDLHERPENPPQRRQPHGLLAVLRADAIEAANLVFFLRVSLDHPDAGEVLQRVGAHLAQLILRLARPAENMPAEIAHDDGYERHRHHRPQRQPRVDGGHQRQTKKNRHHGVDDGQGAEAHKLAHRVDIVGQTRHQVADLVVLKIAERQLLQMSEHDVAQISLAAARETVNVDAPAEAQKPLQRGRAQYQQRVGQQRNVAFLSAQRRVDAAFDQPRQGDAGEIGGDQGNNADNEQPAVAVNEKFDPVIVTQNLSILLAMKIDKVAP